MIRSSSIECKVVAGAANNPLTSREVARLLARRRILYVPDFLANCGGLIHVATEWYRDRVPDCGECIECAMERLDGARPNNTEIRLKLADGYLKENMRHEAAAAFVQAAKRFHQTGVHVVVVAGRCDRDRV